jgi:hypothetical protein
MQDTPAEVYAETERRRGVNAFRDTVALLEERRRWGQNFSRLSLVQIFLNRLNKKE